MKLPLIGRKIPTYCPACGRILLPHHDTITYDGKPHHKSCVVYTARKEV